jgi:hypothetical protein
MRLRAFAALALATLVVCAAPLAGLALAGHALAPYLDFPPRTMRVVQPPFDWGVFLVLCLPALGALELYLSALGHARPRQSPAAAGRFPWWGWLGVMLIAVFWPVAWVNGLVPFGVRAHTFSLLWIGYILAVNGLVWRRSGASPLTHRTPWFLALFAVSAGFWWLFEYLNQFVYNWYYAGVGGMGDAEYFVRATLPFATVLPAVASTREWLRQFPRLDAMTLPAARGNAALAWGSLVLGTLALAAIGIRPDLLFPMLWIAPVLVLAGLAQLVAGETVFSPLARGDWRPILQPALAALVCGFFWELWNYGSLPKWHYTVPYVQRWQIFEMPLIGYAGYLPFGIECALVMDLVARMIERRAALSSA